MLIEKPTAVIDSKIWELQTAFYYQQGPVAWADGLVPQGSTANCFTADTYATIAANFIKDLKVLDEPLLIIELGGGSGRFAWQFLHRLINYHLPQNQEKPRFTYLLTDIAKKNIDNWREKRRFKPLIEQGILEFGQFALSQNPVVRTDSGELSLAAIPNRPVMLIANYLFDSIPTDLYSIRDKKLYRELLSLSSDDADTIAFAPKTFEKLVTDFSSSPIDHPNTGHDMMDDIILGYLEHDEDICFSVPILGFGFLECCLDREAPLLLLAGDLAFTQPGEFPDEDPFILDSYFAYYTNFHIFAELFRRRGGSAQFQRHSDPDFCAGAFIYPGKAGNPAYCELTETRREAFAQLEEFNPYDAHEMLELMQETIGEASFRQIFAWLRFSRFDPVVAQNCLPLLFEEIHRDDEDLDKDQLYEIYMEAYDHFFPDGSNISIDYAIAQLCLAIQFDREALHLLEDSLLEFGRIPPRLYVYALVLLRLDRYEDAKKALKEAMAIDPEYGPALRTFDEHFGTSSRSYEATVSHLSVFADSPKAFEDAVSTYHKNGAILLEKVFPSAYIEKLRIVFMKRFEQWRDSGLGDPNFVGNKRYTFPIRIQAPFNDPALFSNPLLMSVMTEVMGAKPIINAYGSVVTYPGANSQHVHREHPLLYSTDEANSGLPPHAFTVLIPLIDLNEDLGGTQLWEGTQTLGLEEQWQGEPTVVYAKAGSMLLFDYRVYHGGMPCVGNDLRPVLFITYSLPWFRDTLAFESHAALGISEQELAAIPEENQDLFQFAVKIPH